MNKKDDLMELELDLEEMAFACGRTGIIVDLFNSLIENNGKED